MDPVTGLSLGRIILGICAFVAPELTTRLFGLSPATNQHLPYMSRLFAAREVALGGLTLVASGSTRRNLAMVGVAVDATDAATGALELRARRIPTTAGVLIIGVAAGAVASGTLAVLRGRASR